MRLAVCLTWLFPLLVVAAVIVFGVDLPVLDEWEFIPTLAAMYDGELTAGQLFAQHNEHRLIAPRLVMLGLAALTRWNVTAAMLASVAIATGTFALLLLRLRGVLPRRSPATAWLGALLSLVVFSMSQAENWFWGWQIQIFINLLAVVAGAAVLFSSTFRWTRFAGALACGALALFSFANGVCYWVALGLVLPFAWPTDLRVRRIALPLWVAAATLLLAVYLRGYETPGYHPPVLLFLERPLAFAGYVLGYLGSPLARFSRGAAILLGFAGLAAVVALSRQALRQKLLEPHRLAFLWSLGLYALGSALITGIGRVGIGQEQALASRYVTIASLLWVALIVLLFVKRATFAPADVKARATGLLLGGLTLLLLSTGWQGVAEARDRFLYLDPLREFARSRRGAPAAELAPLGRLHPSPQLLERDLATLQRLRLSLFRTEETAPGD